MKSGASDPFADDTNKQTDDTAEENHSSSITGQSETGQSGEKPSTAVGNTKKFDRSDLPRILARNKVKDDRDHVHQLFVYQDTHDFEENARRDLEDRFETDLYKLDIREAIYRAGMENLDDAETVLRGWGADI